MQTLLKKSGPDQGVLSNFRPISKLPFISQILEKVKHMQLKFSLGTPNIMAVFQSGFDILLANDTNCSVQSSGSMYSADSFTAQGGH